MTRRTISAATEDYLKTIYDLGGRDVKTQALAEALSVSAASVSGMLKKLHALKLITYEKYRGVSLTPAGRKVALETLRHHRLIETYLSEALGYPWHEVHDEAERLEHVISEAFEARIAEALGHPTFDPHGDPIPQTDGSLPAPRGRPLTELEPGRRARLTRITDQRREVLVYLESQGLKPGAELEVVARAPLAGPVTLRCGGQQLALSLELAETLHATPLDPSNGP
ncbi:metal-dependent transcriptional regulator [Truepera radiovictrix]|uniref:Manganese transport regulator n=1 Tax=Truepera radiovictrix (strain DSM 17093 / CIP 108686 / LMG 22925 / RQ-24) TaxID=649638 RepID=D7CUY0_TRURR|nr:metal-dependent transcriptional regulator [Truepera radiovictrix]ADI15807.1 iron (metal) dependent repressor, DtxR family [Truepera radiovictrix DSM 17093]WMT58565.1 metal-dependent transcriptional regulator [Truepera radiovictrix]